MSNIANWFEIPVKDMERAKGFYGEAFGLKFQMAEMGPMVLAMIQGDPEAGGASGALIKAEGSEPSMIGTIVYLNCEEVAAQLERIERLGGKTIVPRTSIGEWGFIGHFVDTEGNHVALHSMK